ncbi:hypothetical protein CDLVIII_3293 [Clostridium sp. DL-VIII]|uniref:hypothetical protein n=1 Tax=Clostridium sp. DL-VIII TaxID=641107 RepID=UPI00023B0185|nr:hypothetical protein [Clostridium sp. DL-VIII]EHI99866.1 hypothetical protein CDLVIII_3293 [Clostridium sp. DL-VIII]
MFYLYSLSIGFSFIVLILFLIRILLNKKNINLKNSKYNRKMLLSLIVIAIVPIINIFFTLSGAYLSLLMKKEKFIEFMNE